MVMRGIYQRHAIDRDIMLNHFINLNNRMWGSRLRNTVLRARAHLLIPENGKLFFKNNCLLLLSLPKSNKKINSY